MNITPFKVDIPQADLDDLHRRLEATRFPDDPVEPGWATGADAGYMRELIQYWRHQFDWRKTESKINAFPNFIAEIDGYRVHFLHIRGKGANSVPLIMTHGWPGSFLEMLSIIPLLTEQAHAGELTFDLVIPSIPGFGFSSRPVEPGCSSSFVADLWCKLMTGLGYDRFAAQGGDIGAGVSTWIALHHSERVIGLHLNYISGSYKPFVPEGESLSAEESRFQQTAARFSAKEGAYAHLHATKPLTAAYGLNDSPAGLCSWMIEKFQSWSDNDGSVDSIFSKDELLSNVSLYWLTQTIHSSMRIYRENSLRPTVFQEGERVTVPTAFAKFPKELPTPPRSYVEKGFNIQRWTEMPAGGHFAAAEQPALLAADIRNFLTPVS